VEIDFLKARKRLVEEGQTISGINGHACPNLFEMYRDNFLDMLEANGYETDESLAKILEAQNDYQYVGDFLAEPLDQLCELAAFGLILQDRIALTGWGQFDFERCYFLHEQMFECFEYVMDSRKRSRNARENAALRHQLNSVVRKFVLDEWTIYANSYDRNKSEFARHYVGLIRQKFEDKNGDPFRVTEKTIREVWLSDTPTAGKPAL
jgi:hypothetical protein